jgi:prepilin-type processing-associated H-X9-DG protein
MMMRPMGLSAQKENTTTCATGLAIFWCPSDPEAHKSRTMKNNPSVPDLDGESMYYTSYAGNTVSFPFGSSRRFADITDGTSNTFLLGEKTHAGLSGQYLLDWHWWPSLREDTLFSASYPLNAYRRLSGSWRNSTAVSGASSLHPGGANFAFADGSIRFIKETISARNFDPRRNPVWTGPTGTYEALATYNGGEVISADAY